MAKKRKQKQSSQQNLYIAIVAAVLVLIAGVFFISQNGGDASTVTTLEPITQAKIAPDDYQSLFVAENTDHILIDVRTPEEFNDGHIEGSVNINVDTIANRLSEIPTDKPIVVYCRSGRRSAIASDILANAGFTNIYDLGGIIDWQAAGYPLQ